MRLHWSPRSPFVRKVMVAAHELGCADALVLQRSVAAMLAPNAAIMADNPLSKIPTLVLDDGRVLYDSRVICEYLDARYAPGTLFPADGPARWRALADQALGDGLLDLLVLWRNERERAIPLAPLLDAFATKLDAALERLDGEAARLAASPFDIGQLALGCALGYLDYRFAALGWRARAPALAAWHAAIAQRPAFLATEPADG